MYCLISKLNGLPHKSFILFRIISMVEHPNSSFIGRSYFYGHELKSFGNFFFHYNNNIIINNIIIE